MSSVAAPMRPATVSCDASEALDRLRRHAAKRERGELESLEDHTRDLLARGHLRFDAYLLPETMSFGYHTPFWAELTEAERLALNHWAYVLQYTRIAHGEGFVWHANRAIAPLLRHEHEDLARLLEREALEEQDHVPAFNRIRRAVEAHHGFPAPRAKPARALFASGPVVRALLRLFGADFVVAYFAGRGIANHVGKGFENPVGRQALVPNPNAAIQRVTLLHARDESNHMAVSRLMAACARTLLPEVPATRPLYARLRRVMQRSLVRYTYSGRLTEAQERRSSLRALRRARALRERSPAFVRALVAAHAAQPSGIDRAINASMARPNARLLAQAAFLPGDAPLWRAELGAPGHRRYLAA